MDYLLLSGASGLLGTYLMHDLMGRGVKLAVLVRANRMATAQQRVETQMAYWENQLGRSLPRPVVLEGDLSSSTLGMSDEDLAWVEKNCKAFMHNAASLTFYAKDDVGEPWLSNREGTRNVLCFCKERGIKEFHHVSTSYVCGTRRELILEEDVDVGQTPGNDYEKSKIESELMVRGAEFIESLTVYRPAIIIGDAKSGYTTTYHGFYVPLKLIAGLLSKASGENLPPEMIKAGIRMGGDRLRAALNMEGHERKNFVPVDWVSACMTEIYCKPEHHGQTYHLTPRNTVPATIFQKVWEDIFFEFNELPQGESSSEEPVNFDDFEGYFVNQMKTYQSYWGNDPEFDSTNTQRVCAHIPCPTIDEEMMKNLCRFAIKDNFGWPKPAVVKPDFDAVGYVTEASPASANSETDSAQKVGLLVSGEGGGECTLSVHAGTIVGAERGAGQKCQVNVSLNRHTFQRLVRKETTVEQAIQGGLVLIEGVGGEGLSEVLTQLFSQEAMPASVLQT